MAPQPGIIEAFLSQLGNMSSMTETAILPTYGTDREVQTYIFYKWGGTKFKVSKAALYFRQNYELLRMMYFV
jgi:hypothetical protein